MCTMSRLIAVNTATNAGTRGYVGTLEFDGREPVHVTCSDVKVLAEALNILVGHQGGHFRIHPNSKVVQSSLFVLKINTKYCDYL